MNFNYDEIIDSSECLYNLDDINAALDRIATALNQRYQGKDAILISIMHGAVVVTGQLLPKLDFNLEIDYIHASRYGNKTQGAELEWKQYPSSELSGKTLILVDDVFDQGITLQKVKEYCLKKGASEIVSVVLLDKMHDRKLTDIGPDYAALRVVDKYVFGFGLDYQGKLRNLPGIFALKNR